MKRNLYYISTAILLVCVLVMVGLPLQAQPGLPTPPNQAPVWAPAILMILGASFLGLKLMRRK